MLKIILVDVDRIMQFAKLMPAERSGRASEQTERESNHDESELDQRAK